MFWIKLLHVVHVLFNCKQSVLKAPYVLQTTILAFRQTSPTSWRFNVGQPQLTMPKMYYSTSGDHATAISSQCQMQWAFYSLDYESMYYSFKHLIWLKCVIAVKRQLYSHFGHECHGNIRLSVISLNSFISGKEWFVQHSNKKMKKTQQN